MYTTGGLSTRPIESPPHAQQGFAEPTLELMPDDSVQVTRSAGTQRQEIAVSGSPHTAQGLS